MTTDKHAPPPDEDIFLSDEEKGRNADEEERKRNEEPSGLLYKLYSPMAKKTRAV